MKVERIDHVAIAVRDLEKAKQFFVNSDRRNNTTQGRMSRKPAPPRTVLRAKK